MSAPEVSIAMRPIAVRREDAAAALGMSLDSFERFVQPELRLIRRGRLRLVLVRSLEEWAEQNAAHVFHDEGRPNGRPSHMPSSNPNGRRQRPERSDPS